MDGNVGVVVPFGFELGFHDGDGCVKEHLGSEILFRFHKFSTEVDHILESLARYVLDLSRDLSSVET